jgi:cation diffusion facilitator CzcD-associated flavoprotein CzcO
LAGARLREAGVENLRIIEKGGDFGGAWYWNRYPRAQCDIESYIYLPPLEETGYIPKEKNSYAPEILEHSRRIGRRFDLYRAACFQTQIKEIRWSEEDLRWIVSTNRDDCFRARFVVMSNGPLNRPKLPGIRGIDSYQGHTFHTSRWDYAYTGGDTTGNLHKLADKRGQLSAPAQRPCNVCPTSPRMRSICTFSSARRHRWMSAATARPTRNG